MSTTHRAQLHRSAVAGIAAITLHTDRAFPRHAHDQFGIGMLLDGAHRSWSGIGQVEAQRGDALMCNPGEMHDGLPVRGEARAWRMLYLDPALVERELQEHGDDEAELARPAVHDPILTQRFGELFARVTDGAPDQLAIDENLVRLLQHVLRRHGVRALRTVAAAPGLAQVRQRLDDAPADTASLAELATLAGVSRFQLVRGFARAFGVTPHAYLVQRRVQRVRMLLAAGTAPADAAAAAGFVDQSHMTRAFVRQYGVTPARYRIAVA